MLLREHALEAFDAGFTPVPPRNDGSKAPGLPTWREWQTERPSRIQIADWFHDRVEGIGYLCGAASGGLVMFELEGRAVKAGLHKALIQALRDLGHNDLAELLQQWIEESPSGGLHFHWRCPDHHIGNLKLAFNANGEVLIETRGEGGYTVAAPSAGRVHKHGKAWRHRRGSFRTCPTITAEQQQIILDLARTFNEKLATVETSNDTPTSNYVTGSSEIGDLIAKFNADRTWEEILHGHFEWVGGPDRDGVQRLKFIGQESGTGATLYHGGKDRLIIWSGTAAGKGWRTAGDGPAPTYDKFSAYVFIKTGQHSTDARLQILRTELGLRTPTEQDEELGINRLAQSPAERTARQPTPPDNPNDTHTLQLPDTFWTARPRLAHIRQAADNALVPADALLGATLALIALHTDHRYILPALGDQGRAAPLNVHIGLVGGSGGGKGSALDLAEQLVTPPEQLGYRTRQVNAGSGEGMIKAFFTRQKDPDDKRTYTHTRSYDGILVRVDEGEFVTNLAARQGQTTLQVMRTAWSGEHLGGTYSNEDKNMSVPAYTYRWVMIAAVQPTLAGPLLGDEAGGTAQRQLWFSLQDPNITGTSPNPGPLNWQPLRWTNTGEGIDKLNDTYRTYLTVNPTIHHQIRHDRIAAIQDPGSHAPGHRNLAKLKTAALLALLDERPDITVDDWQLAEHIHTVSDNLARMMHDTIVVEQQHAARRQGAIDAARSTARTVSADKTRGIAARLAAHVQDHTEPVKNWELKRRVKSNERHLWDVAIDLAVANGWIVWKEDKTWIAGPQEVPK